ncbi:CIC11C00000005000 [Sungouiella intermedia]|uniref:CIC11C00000005000 n=1 Tax=Sungouiella intermedia TaxID=45354 RepID=A0A1L0BE30_9ASCO|nr:CIC11C00000005000 [[Candida] intermedia]
MITKFVLYGFVECFETQLLWITSHILLAWLDEYPNEVEIFIVMFVVPVFMNCLQLILVDNFIQNQFVLETNSKLNREHMQHVDDEQLERDLEREFERLVKSHSAERTYSSVDN